MPNNPARLTNAGLFINPLPADLPHDSNLPPAAVAPAATPPAAALPHPNALLPTSFRKPPPLPPPAVNNIAADAAVAAVVRACRARVALGYSAASCLNAVSAFTSVLVRLSSKSFTDSACSCLAASVIIRASLILPIFPLFKVTPANEAIYSRICVISVAASKPCFACKSGNSCAKSAPLSIFACSAAVLSPAAARA